MYREQFCELFEIAKFKTEVPGRDWDDDGLASWYVEEVYPSFNDSLFFELLDLAEDFDLKIDFQLEPSDIPYQYSEILPERLCKAFIDEYNRIEDKDDFKNEVNEYVNTYIEEVNNGWTKWNS